MVIGLKQSTLLQNWTNPNKKFKKCHSDCSLKSIQIADVANQRIFDKFNRLHFENKKNTNKAKVAVANEAIR